MNLYVGGLSYGTTDEQLTELFAQMGEVRSARVIRDRDTGQSRGFGFVEMPNDEEARRAIRSLNGTTLSGRTIIVNEAHERGPRPGGRGDRRRG